MFDYLLDYLFIANAQKALKIKAFLVEITRFELATVANVALSQLSYIPMSTIIASDFKNAMFFYRERIISITKSKH